MRKLTYKFSGPYLLGSVHENNPKVETYHVDFGEEWGADLEGFDLFSMQSSDFVQQQIADIQKVLSGQKAEHYFAGFASLGMYVGKQKTEFYNGLEDRSIGFVPTTGLLQLMIDWRDFLKSKGF
jgi:hypothetical protein